MKNRADLTCKDTSKRNFSLHSAKQLPEAEKAAEQLDSLEISGGKGDSSTGQGSGHEKQEEIKRLSGGKVKRKEKPEIVVEKVVRNKRKCLTMIKGLDMFGIRLADASKKLGKKFASGASGVKSPTEKEQIEVQGDIMMDIVDFITETWKEYDPDSNV